MKEQKYTLDQLLRFFLSTFCVGYAPFAPGTFGSIATLPIILLLAWLGINLLGLLILILVLTITSCIATHYIQKKYGLHDPQWIVMDETIGMLITWAFSMGTDWKNLLIVLILFRFFDIIKFWPASYFDKMEHGAGTILDDVVSGVMAGIILILGNYFLGYAS